MKARRRKRCDIIATGVNSDRTLELLSGKPAQAYQFRLYIAGTNLHSSRAIQHVRKLCRLLCPSQVDLEIIDLYQQPGMARHDNVIAAPVLIKISPPPRRTFVGDLSETVKVLTGLGITTARTKDVGTES